MVWTTRILGLALLLSRCWAARTMRFKHKSTRLRHAEASMTAAAKCEMIPEASNISLVPLKHFKAAVSSCEQCNEADMEALIVGKMIAVRYWPHVGHCHCNKKEPFNAGSAVLGSGTKDGTIVRFKAKNKDICNAEMCLRAIKVGLFERGAKPKWDFKCNTFTTTTKTTRASSTTTIGTTSSDTTTSDATTSSTTTSDTTTTTLEVIGLGGMKHPSPKDFSLPGHPYDLTVWAKDYAGSSLEGVEVQVTNEEDEPLSPAAKTDERGLAHIAVGPGKAKLQLKMDGYMEHSQRFSLDEDCIAWDGDYVEEDCKVLGVLNPVDYY